MSRLRVYLVYGSTIARLSRGSPKLTQLGSPSSGFSPGPPLGPQETDNAREMGFLSKRHSCQVSLLPLTGLHETRATPSRRTAATPFVSIVRPDTWPMIRGFALVPRKRWCYIFSDMETAMIWNAPTFSLEPTAASPSVCGGAGTLAAPRFRRCSVSGGCGSAWRWAGQPLQ
jgi:hypothetical protein